MSEARIMGYLAKAAALDALHAAQRAQEALSEVTASRGSHGPWLHAAEAADMAIEAALSYTNGEPCPVTQRALDLMGWGLVDVELALRG